MEEFDREKYISILKSQGLSAAITQLHHDLWEIENYCFEGAEGYQPDLFLRMKDYRAFSEELWQLGLTSKFAP